MCWTPSWASIPADAASRSESAADWTAFIGAGPHLRDIRVSRAERAYTAASWIPLVGFVGVWLYIRQFEGWGGWGAAGLILIPLLASVIMCCIGLGLIVSARAGRRPAKTLLIATLLSGVPLLFIGLRMIIAP